MRSTTVLFAVLIGFGLRGEPVEQGSLLFQAIRNGDLTFVKAHLTKAEIDVSDRGWGGNPYMPSDAFATGVALVVLAESKVTRVNENVYRRGVDFLLSNQFPDGAWHVRSRAIKFQPYFESGFPFGHDQWISTAATAWAAQAVALSLQPASVVANVR